MFDAAVGSASASGAMPGVRVEDPLVFFPLSLAYLPATCVAVTPDLDTRAMTY